MTHSENNLADAILRPNFFGKICGEPLLAVLGVEKAGAG
jgi:hypothetical protein